MKVSDIQNMFMNVFSVSNKSLPYITITTAPGNKINYYFIATSSSLSANKHYCLYTNSEPLNIYNKTKLVSSSIETATASGSTGTNPSLFNDELITSIVIQTKDTESGTALAVNETNFILNTFNVQIDSGTTQFTFSNAGSVSNYMFYNLFNGKNSDFTPAVKTQYSDMSY